MHFSFQEKPRFIPLLAGRKHCLILARTARLRPGLQKSPTLGNEFTTQDTGSPWDHEAGRGDWQGRNAAKPQLEDGELWIERGRIQFFPGVYLLIRFLRALGDLCGGCFSSKEDHGLIARDIEALSAARVGASYLVVHPHQVVGCLGEFRAI
jgi:hypothetical protein